MDHKIGDVCFPIARFTSYKNSIHDQYYVITDLNEVSHNLVKAIGLTNGKENYWHVKSITFVTDIFSKEIYAYCK